MIETIVVTLAVIVLIAAGLGFAYLVALGKGMSR